MHDGAASWLLEGRSCAWIHKSQPWGSAPPHLATAAWGIAANWGAEHIHAASVWGSQDPNPLHPKSVSFRTGSAAVCNPDFRSAGSWLPALLIKSRCEQERESSSVFAESWWHGHRGDSIPRPCCLGSGAAEQRGRCGDACSCPYPAASALFLQQDPLPVQPSCASSIRFLPLKFSFPNCVAVSDGNASVASPSSGVTPGLFIYYPKLVRQLPASGSTFYLSTLDP